jgi:DNA-binding response OmpR family regulator
LADNDRALRRMVAATLSFYGYTVEQAGSGLALQDRLRRLLQGGRAPDLIIADFRMPGPTGLDVLRTIRRWKWDTPFLLITASDDEEIHDEARRLGADAVLIKPFDIEDLCAVSLYLIRRSVLRQRRG